MGICESCEYYHTPAKQEGHCFKRYAKYLRYEGFKIGKFGKNFLFDSQYQCKLLENALKESLIEGGLLSETAKSRRLEYDLERVELTDDIPTKTPQKEFKRKEIPQIVYDKIREMLETREHEVFQALLSGKKLSELADGWNVTRQYASKVKISTVKKLRELLSWKRDKSGKSRLLVDKLLIGRSTFKLSSLSQVGLAI